MRLRRARSFPARALRREHRPQGRGVRTSARCSHTIGDPRMSSLELCSHAGRMKRDRTPTFDDFVTGGSTCPVRFFLQRRRASGNTTGSTVRKNAFEFTQIDPGVLFYVLPFKRIFAVAPTATFSAQPHNPI